jgi:hypothetical protein
MNNIVKRLIRDEGGQAMLLAVILLLVGGLIVASLLSYMGTGLLVNPVYEGRVAELYGADAGVEDAVWKIQNQDGYLPCNPSSPPRTYNITVNDKNVAVNITSEFSVSNLTFIYHVVATATGDGSGTQVDAYITGEAEYGDYSGILDQVLTSQGLFYCPKQQVCECADLADLVYPGCEDEENGPEPNYDGAWPDEPDELEKFADFYWQQVKDEIHYASPIDLYGSNITLDGGYLDATPAKVTNSVQGDESVPVLKLEGPLYSKGRAEINPTQEMILDLNGQTIFVESSSIKSVDGQYALWIGAGGGGVNTKLKIKGPGIIIAIGDIYFAPGEQMGVEDYPIFIFSVLGKAELQPGGDFSGAVAAGGRVELKSNNNINYPEGGFDDYGLNFPGFGEVQLVYSIASWEVTPLSPEDFAG